MRKTNATPSGSDASKVKKVTIDPKALPKDQIHRTPKEQEIFDLKQEIENLKLTIPMKPSDYEQPALLDDFMTKEQ